MTLSSVALLESLSFITPSDARTIRSRLPSPSGPFPAAALSSHSDISSSFGSLNVAGTASPSYTQSSIASIPPRGSDSPPETKSRALWDYHGAEADDLAFKAGDTIIIDEEVNDQWYRGRVIPQGQTFPLNRSGLFPSNYVEKSLNIPQSPPYYTASAPPVGSQAVVHYQGGVPQQPYYDQKLPMQGQMVPMPAQQQVQGGVQDQQDERRKKYGKIGGQLQNAAVTGAGFGFGSAVASNIVNKIF